MKTTHLFIPTDFSDGAWKAMCYAANLFRETTCKYYLINTNRIPIEVIEGSLYNGFEETLAKAEKDLKKLSDQFQELDHHNDTVIEAVASLGTILGTIENLNDNLGKEEDRFVIMNTKGIDEISDYLFGTLTSNLVSKSALPVYCIPEKTELNCPKNILLAVDSELLKDSEILKTVVSIAKRHKSFVYVVNVSNEATLFCEGAPERFIIHEYLHEIQHSFTSIKGSFVQDELIQFSHQKNIDLIVMIKHKKSFWQQLFEKSNTNNMSLYSDTPLLILKENNS